VTVVRTARPGHRRTTALTAGGPRSGWSSVGNGPSEVTGWEAVRGVPFLLRGELAGLAACFAARMDARPVVHRGWPLEPRVEHLHGRYRIAERLAWDHRL